MGGRLTAKTPSIAEWKGQQGRKGRQGVRLAPPVWLTHLRDTLPLVLFASFVAKHLLLNQSCA